MDNTSIKENFKKIYDVVLLADSDKDTFTFDGMYPLLAYDLKFSLRIFGHHVANVEQHENHYTMKIVDMASFIELGQKFLYGLD